MAEFVLDIKDIGADGLQTTFVVEPSWLRHALADAELGVPEGARPGKLGVHAQRSGDDILVQAHLEAQVVASCARCLNDVVIDVDTDITQLLSPEHARPRVVQELELEGEDLDREYYSGERIVLDDAVREQAILEVPMQVLCPEPPGCQPIEIPEGVRPPADLGRGAGGSAGERPGEIDPRLAPLLNLKRKLENDEE